VGHESLRVCLLSVFMRVERACVYACVRARASVRARACVHGCGWVCARVRARLGEGTTARFVRKPSLEAVYDAVASRCWWPSCVRWKLTSVTFATLHDGSVYEYARVSQRSHPPGAIAKHARGRVVAVETSRVCRPSPLSSAML
jgi:hypothetical protein